MLFKARPAQPWPLSTDMHLLQGAVELKDVQYDPARKTLSGRAIRHPGAAGRVTIFIPSGYVLATASVPVEAAKETTGDRTVDLLLDFSDAERYWEAVFQTGENTE